MLTLSETIAAVRALDTAPDIIEQACRRIVFPVHQQQASATDEERTTKALAEILDAYMPRLPLPCMIVLGLMLAGRLAGATGLPGADEALTKGLADQLLVQFGLGRMAAFNTARQNNPDKARALLMGAIESALAAPPR